MGQDSRFTPDSESEIWLQSVVQRTDGYECQAFEQYAHRLLRLAGSRLPDGIRQRIDADDVVQSAFRSFFHRHQQGQFDFAEADDVWRILAAITYRKVQRAIRFHGQEQRDTQREAIAGPEELLAEQQSPSAVSALIMAESLSKILNRLPALHQSTFQLRLDGYSIQEIATRTGVTTRTVDRGLALARKVAAEVMDEP